MGRRYRNPTYVRDKQCPHCGFFFTPQGFSGHLRFAHKPAKDKGFLGRVTDDLTGRQMAIQIYAKQLGLPEEQVNEARQWLDEWGQLTLRGVLLGVEFTQDDFKGYIRARFMKSRGLPDK